MHAKCTGASKFYKMANEPFMKYNNTWFLTFLIFTYVIVRGNLFNICAVMFRKASYIK